jgi:D-aspartate ligase
MTPVGAVVVGGDYRGLGIVRSLGRRGVPVWVVHGAEAVARHSRYCRRAIRQADGDGEALVAVLLRLAAEHGPERWVLFPTSDESAWVVSRHWDELTASYRLTVPPWEVYSRAADKWCVREAASSLGLHTPRSWHPGGVDELARFDISDEDFPLVIKPTRREGLNALTSVKAWRIDDRAMLMRRYRDALEMLPADQIMIQQWIRGDGQHQYAVAAVCSAGEPRYVVAARRTRQYPRDIGRASCFVETIDDPDLVKEATRLMTELGIDGLVEVEFKLDDADGRPKLLDVNVRVWGWHSIGAAAGVDFSHAAYRLALGDDLEQRTGAGGVRWTRLSVDLAYAVADVAGGRMQLRELLRSLRPPLEGPIAARDDPLPALLELPQLIGAIRRQRRANRTTDG